MRYTPAKLISLNTNNATLVKSTAGSIGYLACHNLNAAARYVKLFDKATAPTPGTDIPKHTFMIPGGSTAGSAFSIPLPAEGIQFAAGIGLCLVTGIADTDNTAVAANEVLINYGWR